MLEYIFHCKPPVVLLGSFLSRETWQQEEQCLTLGQLRGPPGPPGSGGGGLVYTRWGKTTCPCTATLVYGGYMAGSWYRNTGGGSNYLCLPKTPEYSTYVSGDGGSGLNGVEYEVAQGPLYSRGVNQHEAPCAVCDVPQRSRQLMIPAKVNCPSGWTREYYGYLMAGGSSRTTERMSFVCVDRYPEVVPGSYQNKDASAPLYHVEATCHTLPCSPYNDYKELTCVVCTK